MTELSSLRLLMRQRLAVRGHDESEGNLYQVMKCRAEDVLSLHEWLRNRKYLSHDIVNEMIECMAHQLLCELLSEIKEVEWYALIADETHDLSVKEQFVVTIRWVGKD